jgi:menaquinone-dependent protoporphyrinogen IX oxidase
MLTKSINYNKILIEGRIKMETLQEKIEEFKTRVAALEKEQVSAKERFDEDTKSRNAKKADLNKVLKKLEKTQAEIDAIFAAELNNSEEESENDTCIG